MMPATSFRSKSMSSCALLQAFWLLVLTPLTAAYTLVTKLPSSQEARQVPGTDSCTCSPTDYTFTLNLNGDCEENDVVPSDAIERVRCIISDEGFQDIANDVPTVITQIDVLEFGLNLTLLSETSFPGVFNDGDMFDWGSITGTASYEGTNVPQIFQLSLNGLNSDGEMVRNSLGVVFTNECGVEPIFTEGDEFGWLIFTAFTDPIDDFCQAQPTAAPISGPPTPTPEPMETCSCSPREFTFQFNFTAECPGNIEPDDAIERVGCVIDNDFQDQVMDNTPTRVTKVSIEETTATGSIMKLDISSQVFENGDTFTYESASEDGFLTPTSLQIVLEGENEINVGVFNVVLFEYTNECGVEVVFADDAAVGWLIIDDYTPGRPEMCQAATAEPTESPTESPTTLEPTETPSEAPFVVTPSPTNAPTPSPTDIPTLEPTSDPTAAPVVDPTPSPTSEPTESPTSTPTEAPTVEPTESPTTSPTDIPTLEPTSDPTIEPTASPTADPTSNPTGIPPTTANVLPTQMQMPSSNPKGSPPTAANVLPTQMSMPPMPISSPTVAPPTMANVIPTQMQMTPMPTSQQTSSLPTGNGAATPTQMSMPPQPTPPPTDDPNMSFDINRLLELMHKEEQEMLRSSPTRIVKPEDSASSSRNNIRRRLKDV